MLKEKIENLKKQFLAEIEKIKPSDEALFELEKKYTGRKSEFIGILKSLKDLSPEEKKQIGELANNTKNQIWEIIKNKREEISENSFDAEKEKIDVTIPGKKKSLGHWNPISLVRRDIEDIFVSMGYEIADGPEVETGWYNFDALNIPKDHPARDMQDTFFLDAKDGEEKLSMRSQTSAVQARYMEKNKPPLRIIVPGKCYRREATDTTHDHTFYQFEALIAGENVNVGNLKFTAQEFFSAFFKQNVTVRLRPSYFPFVEPGMEVDISCLICGGTGCHVCKKSGWLEIAGAGMIHPEVFKSGGIDPEKYTGYAWGMGIERPTMIKHGIKDIRLFLENDVRFLNQFV